MILSFSRLNPRVMEFDTLGYFRFPCSYVREAILVNGFIWTSCYIPVTLRKISKGCPTQRAEIIPTLPDPDNTGGGNEIKHHFTS